MIRLGLKQSLVLAAAAILIAAGVIAVTARFNEASASQKYSFGATQTGSFAIKVDFDDDDVFDYQKLASYHKGGLFVLDGMLLPASVIGKAVDMQIDPGHGTWRYNANNGKFSYVSYHAESSGGTGYVRISGSFNDRPTGTPSPGKITIEVFSAPGEEVPSFVTNSHTSAFDLSVF